MTTAARSSALSAAEVLSLPAMPSARDAFAACGISGDLGYQLIRDNEFPIEVIKFGRVLRVRRADLLNFLGLGDQVAVEETSACPVYQPGQATGNDEAARVPAGPPQSSKSAPTSK